MFLLRVLSDALSIEGPDFLTPLTELEEVRESVFACAVKVCKLHSVAGWSLFDWLLQIFGILETGLLAPILDCCGLGSITELANCPLRLESGQIEARYSDSSEIRHCLNISPI